MKEHKVEILGTNLGKNYEATYSDFNEKEKLTKKDFFTKLREK
jgi:hypothetical protein